MTDQIQLADDLMKGADEIARFMGEDVKRVYRMLEAGEIPSFKLAGRWCARRSTLLAHFDELERGAGR